ncbi:MAG: 30S ribosomal protein S7 [Candidatus Margulisiibacteriota bacterium]
MPRHGKTPKRKAQPDVIYNSVMVQKFINKMMIQGKKSKSENIFYRTMDEIKKRLNKEPLETFEKAMTNVSPLLEVKARRVGGATYQVPVEISRERAQAMAMQWLREGARERGGRSMVENLASELIDAANNAGVAIKNKETLHKTAEANKAFAHFRW